MKTQYDDILGLAELPDEEKKKTVIAAATAVLKTPSYFGFLILQIIGFICLAIWLPRGAAYLPIVFAYIFLTYLPLKRYWNRLVRQRIGESLAAKTGV